MKKLLFAIIMISVAVASNSQTTYPAISTDAFADGVHHWYDLYDKTNLINPLPERPQYAETDIIHIADNILLFQRNNGGWPKNYDMRAILSADQVKILKDTKSKEYTTFDNSTTYTHIEYLAKTYQLTHIERFKQACEKGIRFCIQAQFSNGGWPQYYPLEKGYSRHITLNDGAYMGVLRLMQKISNQHPDFSFLEGKIRKQAEKSYQKGLKCLLKMQIVDNGKLTVWCQQHDEITLQPAWARAFEPPAICNGESADIVIFLMSIPQPSPEIIQSVQGAIQWFHRSQILYTKVKTVDASPEESKYRTIKTDRIVVTDSTAAPIWTRYYEPVTDRPLFCDRNSKYLYSLSQVSRERRTGYAWYTYAPQKALDKYLQWQKLWVPDQNVLPEK